MNATRSTLFAIALSACWIAGDLTAPDQPDPAPSASQVAPAQDADQPSTPTPAVDVSDLAAEVRQNRQQIETLARESMDLHRRVEQLAAEIEEKACRCTAPPAGQPDQPSDPAPQAAAPVPAQPMMDCSGGVCRPVMPAPNMSGPMMDCSGGVCRPVMPRYRPAPVRFFRRW